MIRVIVFLALIGLAALGGAWIAEQPGNISLVWNGWRVQTSLPVVVLSLGVVIAVAIFVWSLLRGLWRLPRRMQQAQQRRQSERARRAIARGLIAVGSGDSESARRHAQMARRHAEHDPLALLLHAQAAQLSGDRDAARGAFHAMAQRADTRLLGLRGLFIEAQRNDDPAAAIAIAEEALKTAPDADWAAQAVLGFRCAAGDWSGALDILDREHRAGAISAHTYRRQRAVLLTAKAIDLETADRDVSRQTVMEAVKLAPTLVPAAVLAAKFLSQSQQIRKAMRIIEAAWVAHPHPDLADAYAHARTGDSARQRLSRIETLAAKTPGHAEGALAIAGGAIDAREFARARDVLAPLTERPTQRVAMLMAEIERHEHDDSGAARRWTVRAVHALHDPAWSADGYVSDRWRPVSPVTGRIDAFQWVTPVAAMPSAGSALESGDDVPRRALPVSETESGLLSTPSGQGSEAAASPTPAAAPSEQPPALIEAATTGEADADPDEPARQEPVPPIFRPRRDIGRTRNHAPVAVPPVIPILRAPDDPGVDDDENDDSLAETGVSGQAGGMKGFLSRWSR